MQQQRQQLLDELPRFRFNKFASFPVINFIYIFQYAFQTTPKIL